MNNQLAISYNLLSEPVTNLWCDSCNLSTGIALWMEMRENRVLKAVQILQLCMACDDRLVI